MLHKDFEHENQVNCYYNGLIYVAVLSCKHWDYSVSDWNFNRKLPKRHSHVLLVSYSDWLLINPFYSIQGVAKLKVTNSLN